MNWNAVAMSHRRLGCSCSHWKTNHSIFFSIRNWNCWPLSAVIIFRYSQSLPVPYAVYAKQKRRLFKALWLCSNATKQYTSMHSARHTYVLTWFIVCAVWIWKHTQHDIKKITIKRDANAYVVVSSMEMNLFKDSHILKAIGCDCVCLSNS